jgi:hypothetical protein
MLLRRPIFALLLAALLPASAAPLAAQDVSTNKALPEIPFDDWVAEPHRADIPWSVGITSPQLAIIQRFVVEFRVQVPSRALNQFGPSFQLFLEVRLKPAGAQQWLEAREIAATRLLQRMPKGNGLEISMQALVLPGEYTVGMVLYERISGHRSVALRKLKVRPLDGDRLPEISRNLPQVEFFQRGVDDGREALGELHSRLWIPLTTRRPLHVELLVNLAAPEPLRSATNPLASSERNLSARHQRNLARMLGIIKVLSQLELTNGSLHITALDILRRSVLFEQDAGKDLDWPRLHAALEELNPLSIPVQALEGRRKNAAFFREVIQQRLPTASSAEAHGTNGNGAGAEDPLYVFIVVSSPAIFERGADLSPVQPPPGADLRAYYLQYHLNTNNVWDDLPRVLRQLGPRRFDLQSPEEFRRALARILNELRAL